MGKKRSIAVFNQGDLSFIGAYDTTSSAALNVLGGRRKNGNITKYLRGEIHTYFDKIWIDVDFSAGITSDLISQWQTVAKRRRDRVRLFKLNNETIAKFSDEDVEKINDILSKYI